MSKNVQRAAQASARKRERGGTRCGDEEEKSPRTPSSDRPETPKLPECVKNLVPRGTGRVSVPGSEEFVSALESTHCVWSLLKHPHWNLRREGEATAGSDPAACDVCEDMSASSATAAECWAHCGDGGREKGEVLPEAAGCGPTRRKPKKSVQREWRNTRFCGICNTTGSYFSWRSHCRVCGINVCQSCILEGKAEWLVAPYVELCDRIPDTHKTVMKVCLGCKVECEDREETWMWAQLLPCLMLRGVHYPEWTVLIEKSMGNPNRATIKRCATKLRDRYLALTSHDKVEFANKGYRKTALDDALIATVPKLHVFDVVHRTPKFEATPPQNLQLHSLPFYIVLSILHVPASATVVKRGCKELVHRKEEDDMASMGSTTSTNADTNSSNRDERVETEVQRRGALAVILPFVHGSNRARMLGEMSLGQRVTAYLHDRSNSLVPSDCVPERVVQQLEQHRNNMDLLHMISVSEDGPMKTSLMDDFRASKQAALFYKGRMHALLHMRCMRPGLMEVRIAPDVLLTLWLDQVDRRLIVAAAFAHYDLYKALFQRTLALPFQTHVENAPPSPAAMIRPSISGREIDCPPDVHTIANTTSTFIQSLLLTVLQISTGKFVDRERARYLVDKQGRLLYYWAPLMETEELEESEEAEELREQKRKRERAEETHAQQVVRKAIVNVFHTHIEYVFWLGFILTGTRRHFRPIEDDNPFVFLV